MPGASNRHPLTKEYLTKFQSELDNPHPSARGLLGSRPQNPPGFQWLHAVPKGSKHDLVVDIEDKDEFPDLEFACKNKTRNPAKGGPESQNLALKKSHQEKINNFKAGGPDKTTTTGRDICWPKAAKKETDQVDNANKAETFPKMDTAEPEMTTIDGFPIRCSQRQRKGKGKGKGKGCKGNAKLSS